MTKQVNNNVNVQKITCVRDLFKSMEGTWKLCRNLNQTGFMYGKVIFSKMSDALLYNYQEEGIVDIQGKPYRAYRTYNYTYKNDRILIYACKQKSQQSENLLHILEFADFTLNQWPLNSYSVYSCEKDIYNLHFMFSSTNSIQLNYEIRGPYKDYIIKTNIFRG